MNPQIKTLSAVRCFLAMCLAVLPLAALAHTLPISYLHLVPDADYLHLELVFNVFELTFVSEVDDNKDAELSPAELTAHGSVVADRVAGALKLSLPGRELHPETAGLDPDLTGHHVRLRAHYKVDARHLPLTVESDLMSLTSASHLTQVTYANDIIVLRAQLDSQNRKVTFTPRPEKQPPSRAQRQSAVFGLWLLLLAVLALLVVGAGVLLYLRKQIQ